MQYVTTQTTGNSSDFGDLVTNTNQCTGSNVSSATRGIFFAGGPSTEGTINYITIATLGNSKEFGEATLETGAGKGTCASPTRAVAASGDAQSPTYSNIIQYIQISTTGNAVDFGDLATVRGYTGGLSNGHGGLG